MDEEQEIRKQFFNMCMEHLYKKYHRTHKPVRCSHVIDAPKDKIKRFTLTLVNKNNHEFFVTCIIDDDSFNKLQKEDLVFENLFDKKILYHRSNSCEYYFSYKDIGELVLSKI